MGTFRSGQSRAFPRLREMFALADTFPSPSRASQDIRIELPRGGMSSLAATFPGMGLPTEPAEPPRAKRSWTLPILAGLLLVAAYRG